LFPRLEDHLISYRGPKGEMIRILKEKDEAEVYGKELQQLCSNTLTELIDNPDIPIRITDTWDD